MPLDPDLLKDAVTNPAKEDKERLNIHYSIFNSQFPDKSGYSLRYNPGSGITAALRTACPGGESEN